MYMKYILTGKMKNKKYQTARRVPKSNRKTKNTKLPEEFQNLIEKQKIPNCQKSSKFQYENLRNKQNRYH